MYLFLFLAALGLCCFVWAFSSCGEQGLHFIAARGCLIAVASLIAEHSSRRRGFGICGSWALKDGFSSCSTQI